jgi:hypothetical protein
MPEREVGRRGGARAVSYDGGDGAREREQAAKETPEQAAVKRVELLWHDADSAKQRGAKLSGIVVREEWREERAALKAKHDGLEKELVARAVDAEASERARERYQDAAEKVQALGEELERAKEPRAKPPVRDEVELEPSILSRKMPPEQLLAWVASLDKRERKAVEDRLAEMGGSAKREDGFAVALSNYLGDQGVRKAYEGWARAAGLETGPGQTLRDRFLAVARDPRNWVTLGSAPVLGAKAAGRPGGEATPAAAVGSPSSAQPGADGAGGGMLGGGATPAASASSPIAAPSLPAAVSSSPNSAHPAGQDGKQPAKAGDVQGGGGLEWAGAGKAGRVFRNATADTFVDSATRETVEIETSWTMAEFDQFELKTNMLMEVERKIHIQLAHGGVVIKSRARAFFHADQAPNDVHAALEAPAKLVKHDGAIFVTDDKGMHLLRTLELLLPETPAVAGLLAHEPMLGFDVDPKQRIREADQFVTVTVPTYERNMELVDGIMRDAPCAAMGLKNYIKVKLAYENPPAEALAIGRHMIGRIEELVQFSWTGYEGTDLRVQLGLMWEGFQKLVQQAEAAKPAEKHLLDHASDLVVAIGKAGVGVVMALKEVGLMARDVGMWGLDKLSNAFGYEIDWSASSSIGKAYESGKSTSEIFHAVVDGIIDSWSKAVEHAENGDYSQLMDLGAELALDIAIEAVTAGAATPGVAAKRAGTAARLAEHALVLTEDAAEALTRRTEAMLQRAKQALRRVPEDVRAALLDTIDVASGVIDWLKESVKVADAGVGTVRLVDKTAITQAIQRSRGARAIEAAKGAMTKLRGPAARAQGASVVEKLAKTSKMPDTIYAVGRRIAEGENKAKFVAALDKLLKGTARALDEEVVAGVLRRAADAVDPLAFLDNVEWVMARKGISVEARKALVRQAVLRDSPLDLRWLRELTELPDGMLERMALNPGTHWKSFMKVSKKPSDYFPSALKKMLKRSDYADAGAKLRGVAGELVFELEGVELPGGLKIAGRQVDAAGKVIDFGLQDASGARALLEVKAWSAERWASELAAAHKPKEALAHMLEQLKAAQSTGQPVYLAVPDAIGTRLKRLDEVLQRANLGRVKIVTFPEAKLVKIRGGLLKGLGITAGVATVAADQLLKEEGDDQDLP